MTTNNQDVGAQEQLSASDLWAQGLSGLTYASNSVQDDFIPHLQYPRAAAIYAEMSDNDPTIGAILFMTKQLIKRTGWAVQAAGESPADKEAAEFLESCMHDMSFSWGDTISEILSMVSYGFSFHEIVYKVRGGPLNPKSTHRSVYNDGRIGWAKIAGRAQQSLYGWEFAENGDIKAFIQAPAPTYRQISIPLSQGLLFRTDVSKDNPEGRSMLRNAYRPWYYKKRIEEIEGIGLERDLAGLPTITPPEGANIWDPNDKDAVRARGMAESLVRNIRRDRSEGVVLPHGWELKLLSTGGTRQFDTNTIINRYDNRIAITLLSDIVMMGGDKVGSFALGEVKKSLMAASLESIVAHIADVFNKYAVARLFRLNYFPGISGYPKIVPGEVETPDIKDMAFLLRASGLDATTDLALMNLLRDMISLPELTPEELAEMYGGKTSPTASSPPPGATGGFDPEDPEFDSQNVDPLGHAMDDGNQNYEGR